MKIRCLTFVLAALLAVPTLADAQQLVVNPTQPVAGPVNYYTNGIYSPYPGIWTPIPYPGWNYPPHWIYSYMRFDDGYGSYGDRSRRSGDRWDGEGKAYRGRDTLAPAVPYSEFLRDKELLKRDAPSMPAADRALLNITMPQENAKLYFNGTLAPGTGEVRTFQTPPLKAGVTYEFTLKAEWFLGGGDDQVVSFRAGETKNVDLRKKN